MLADGGGSLSCLCEVQARHNACMFDGTSTAVMPTANTTITEGNFQSLFS